MSYLTFLQKYAYQSGMENTLAFLPYLLLVHPLARNPVCTSTKRMLAICYLPKFSMLRLTYTCKQEIVGLHHYLAPHLI